MTSDVLDPEVRDTYAGKSGDKQLSRPIQYRMPQRLDDAEFKKSMRSAISMRKRGVIDDDVFSDLMRAFVVNWVESKVETRVDNLIEDKIELVIKKSFDQTQK